MVERLTRELEAVGGVVHRAGSPEEAGAAILRILAERQTRRVIRGATQLIEELELDAGLERAGIEVTIAGPRTTASRQGLRDAAFAADAGITSVDVGVAETGTLAILACKSGGQFTEFIRAEGDHTLRLN